MVILPLKLRKPVRYVMSDELEGLIEHKWKIKILKTKKYDFNVGISSIDFDNKNIPYKSGWYLYCKNSQFFSGPPHNFTEKETNLKSINDEIIVIMNMKEKTLKFIIDNEENGDYYKDIPLDKPITPAVILYDIDDSVEIIKC